MRFATELVDAVTLERVTSDVKVSAHGLLNRPIVSASGFFVWLEEAAREPTHVLVDAAGTPYESTLVPVPVLPQRSVRIELSPRASYPFTRGTTGWRGNLVERLFGTAEVVSGAEVWLQWIDDSAAGTTWRDATTHSHTDARGDFAAVLRLAPSQLAQPHPEGGISARLRVRRDGGSVRSSTEFSLPEGRVADAPAAYAWGELEP